MAQKIKARFFTVRRSKAQDFMCSIRGGQAGTILRHNKQFWAFALKGNRSSDMFNTFGEAELWLWLNYT